MTTLLLGFGALAGIFFVIRPELWRRLWGDLGDPRPAGLMRIAFGLVFLWTLVRILPDARAFLTDEGIWLPDMARAQFGGQLAHLWDPEHGFEHWWSPLLALLGPFTVLHFRSEPALVYGLYGLMLAAVSLMTAGLWTRWTTAASWLLVLQVYRYEPIYQTGAEFVIRVFLFLGMLSCWGEAYSIDSWVRRRRAVRSGARTLPAPRLIPMWPMRLMMVQLAVIYAATGLYKHGEAWSSGVALYYVLSLEQFQRIPAAGLFAWLHHWGLLPLMTYVVRWWEVLFPVTLAGVVLRAYERDRGAGQWPLVRPWRQWLSWLVAAAAWVILAIVVAQLTAFYGLPADLWLGLSPRGETVAVAIALVAAPLVVIPLWRTLRRSRPAIIHWVLAWPLGRRLWLPIGLALHAGINLGVNVGTFAEIMMTPYLVWLGAAEIDAFWAFVRSRPLPAGVGGRPARAGWRRLFAPLDRLRHREIHPVCVVAHHPGEVGVRRAAVLRLWAPPGALAFVAERELAPGQVRVGVTTDSSGPELVRALPGLWWLRPLQRLPVVGPGSARLALRLLS